MFIENIDIAYSDNYGVKSIHSGYMTDRHTYKTER